MTMPKRSRFRRILKWVGVLVCLSICTTIVASWHWTLVYGQSLPSSQDGWSIIYTFGFAKSAVMITRLPAVPGGAFREWKLQVDDYADGWFGNRGRLSLRLPQKLYGAWSYPGMWGYLIPLWLPLSLVGLPTLLLFWRDHRRIPPGYCQRCGYNLTGNVSGKCTECGTPIPDEMKEKLTTDPPKQ